MDGCRRRWRKKKNRDEQQDSPPRSTGASPGGAETGKWTLNRCGSNASRSSRRLQLRRGREGGAQGPRASEIGGVQDASWGKERQCGRRERERAQRACQAEAEGGLLMLATSFFVCELHNTPSSCQRRPCRVLAQTCQTCQTQTHPPRHSGRGNGEQGHGGVLRGGEGGSSVATATSPGNNSKRRRSSRAMHDYCARRQDKRYILLLLLFFFGCCCARCLDQKIPQGLINSRYLGPEMRAPPRLRGLRDETPAAA
jgi:hypothetical protein